MSTEIGAGANRARLSSVSGIILTGQRLRQESWEVLSSVLFSIVFSFHLRPRLDPSIIHPYLVLRRATPTMTDTRRDTVAAWTVAVLSATSREEGVAMRRVMKTPGRGAYFEPAFRIERLGF